MDANELRAAAERVRRVKAGERMRVVYGFGDEKMDDFMYWMLENAATADLKLIADAFLAEHPVDDAEPFDEAWLRSVGFSDDGYGLKCVSEFFGRSDHHLRHTQVYRHGIAGSWHANGIGCRTPETRGAVRRLCSALGIPLGS